MKKLILSLLMTFFSYSTFASGIGINPADTMMFIQNHSPIFYLAIFFGLGILLAFTPCVLPMVPILSSIITGQGANTGSQAFKLSLGYVLGMAVTYAIAGMLAAWLGSTVQTLMQQPIIIGSFSLLFILMALWLLGVFEFRLPAIVRFIPRRSRQHGMLSATLMGVLSTLVVSPCVTAPLIGILTYIAQGNHVFQGGLLLFVLALGMGLPLLIVGAGYGRILPGSGPWMVRIKQVFAIMMFSMAVWLLSRVVPQFWINLLWIVVLLLNAWVLGAFRLEQGMVGRLMQGIALLSIMGAGALMYQTFIPASVIQSVSRSPFTEVHTLEEVNAKLAEAKANNERVFIEFYAGWCSDCQAMDKYVFNQAAVINAMQGFVNLRVDISEKTDEVAKIRQAFHIYGIPTMLFYDKQGQQLTDLSSVGQISKEKTLQLFAQFQNK
ncbi:protein-disulfide reductase DsbD family protein [Legionella longbeachae]|uniref:Putative Thiol:disulfide interchange protein n=1 Tax=Legionella longbeachae serogroup 1 (strain NSW150) TaxID=661367 RepID=D3HS71_LEGLN|nr:protein-disulfide reductase DsbD [Legionella longbeachae]VEE02254.1 thiol:disulfide interchange protein [Legionella oakridgensis]HBD7399328.1 protein-disulfide reductase DsbD [Legionella pneumophila]ARB91449.1 protein-disulfide reductase DsbD [Legionella longbeachae]ARM32125.1 protein-disulfide reductase DsbD [Legionella longbeachae]EEZ95111.1 putative thiol:disulfide interchange protein DsbD [Legionella longbeachae D-4968]